MKWIKYDNFLMALFSVYSVIPLLDKIIPFFNPVIIFSILIFPILFRIKEIKYHSLIPLFLYTLFLIINVLYKINYIDIFIKKSWPIISFALVPLVIMSLNYKRELFFKYLNFLNFLNFSLLQIMIIFKDIFYLNKNVMVYSTFGYWLLPTSLYFYMHFYIKKKKKYIWLSIISLIELLFYGSKFSLILYFVGILMILIFLKRFKIVSIIFLILVLIKLTLTKILIIVLTFFKTKGMDFISLERLLYTSKVGIIEGSSGRTDIYIEAYKNIINNPFGQGILGYIDSGGVTKALKEKTLGYNHNIFLDILQHVGFFGLLVYILIFMYLIKKYLEIKRKENKMLIIIFLAVSLKLLVSGSYLWELSLWNIIGLLYNKRFIRNI